MALKLSDRHAWVIQSEIRNMSIECDKVNGINLSQGICDTMPPVVVRNAAKEAIDIGFNTYTRYDGLEDLRIEIAKKQKQFSKMEVDPEKEIVVSTGSTGALFCACFALLNPGDEVILFEPYYGYHLSTVIATQGVPVYVKTNPPDWSINFDELKKAITKRTKGIIINSPANPSGKVFKRWELEKIADLAIDHDLFVFTDEIYEHFVYDGRQHISLATLPGMKERTITVSGFSKTFSITGWRIGYAICDEKWAKAIGYFNDLFYVCAPAPLQMGVAKGLLEIKEEYYRTLSEIYKEKRDMLCNSLQKAGLFPHIPEGAYYVLADISKVPGKTSKERAMNILYKAGVACVPGEAFYHDGSGENLARFCFAKDDDILDEACRRLESIKF